MSHVIQDTNERLRALLEMAEECRHAFKQESDLDQAADFAGRLAELYRAAAEISELAAAELRDQADAVAAGEPLPDGTRLRLLDGGNGERA